MNRPHPSAMHIEKKRNSSKRDVTRFPDSGILVVVLEYNSERYLMANLRLTYRSVVHVLIKWIHYIILRLSSVIHIDSMSPVPPTLMNIAMMRKNIQVSTHGNAVSRLQRSSGVAEHRSVHLLPDNLLESVDPGDWLES